MRMTLMSAVAAALAVSTAGCAVLGDTAGNDLGKEGEAVHLTIGYQPYYTEA
jgi:NitT/TauT family transport system substrate-binding protein